MSNISPLVPITDIQKALIELVAKDFKKSVSNSWFKFIKFIKIETYNNLLIQVNKILVKYTPIVKKILQTNPVFFIYVWDSRGKFVINTLAGDRNTFNNFVDDTIVSKLLCSPIGQFSNVQEAYAKGESDFVSIIISTVADDSKYIILKNTIGPGRQLIDKVYTFGKKNELIGCFAIGFLLP